MNYTNVCAASCPLCAFYRKGDEDDAYTLTIEQIVTRAGIAVKQMGAKELHIVGGFHPKLRTRVLRSDDEGNKDELSRCNNQGTNSRRNLLHCKIDKKLDKGSTAEAKRRRIRYFARRWS